MAPPTGPCTAPICMRRSLPRRRNSHILCYAPITRSRRSGKSRAACWPKTGQGSAWWERRWSGQMAYGPPCGKRFTLCQAAVRRCDGGTRAHCGGGRRCPGRAERGTLARGGRQRRALSLCVPAARWPSSLSFASRGRRQRRKARRCQRCTGAACRFPPFRSPTCSSRAPDYRKWALYQLCCAADVVP